LAGREIIRQAVPANNAAVLKTTTSAFFFIVISGSLMGPAEGNPLRVKKTSAIETAQRPPVRM
jgi:hypothetical protein